MSNIKKILIHFAILIGATLFVSGTLNSCLFNSANKTYPSESVEITIPKGVSLQKIARILDENHLIRTKRMFVLAARLSGVSRKMKAGEYSIKTGSSHSDILKTLVSGHVVTQKITFPEGMRCSRMAGLLQKKMNVDSTVFMGLVHNEAFCRQLKVDARSLEGYLFPTTYYFPKNYTEKEIINSMVSQFHTLMCDSLVARCKEMNLKLHEVITLASIIEGEASLAEERASISALYHNRLKRHMLIQADPTIQFIIKDGPRRLLHKDLEINSPYNTYKRAGLPPGPVNNPGQASIIAALYPTDEKILYMVANGDGSHTFSRTLEDHNRAKQRFDKIRRQVRYSRRNY